MHMFEKNKLTIISVFKQVSELVYMLITEVYNISSLTMAIWNVAETCIRIHSDFCTWQMKECECDLKLEFFYKLDKILFISVMFFLS